MKKIDLSVIGSGIGGSLISILNKDKQLVLFEKDKNLGGTASTFKRFGNYFIVKSSIGHVRDLPVSGGAKEEKEEKEIKPKTRLTAEEKTLKARSALFGRMGIDPEHDWQAQYQILPGKEKVVAELKALAKTVDTIYLATDLDREGEAIAWHLQEVIGGDPSRYQRVVFNEITKTPSY